jgi:hypothetical protein
MLSFSMQSTSHDILMNCFLADELSMVVAKVATSFTDLSHLRSIVFEHKADKRDELFQLIFDVLIILHFSMRLHIPECKWLLICRTQ